jgi:hypothetical protein
MPPTHPVTVPDQGRAEGNYSFLIPLSSFDPEPTFFAMSPWYLLR